MCQPRPKKNCFLAHLRKKKIHPALSLSREEAQHARLRCARAVPRWLESVAALWKPTVPARRLSSSVHGRAPTCQTRPQTSRFLAHVRKKPSATARALSAGRRRSTLAGEVHAPRRAGWSRFLPYGSPLASKTAFFVGARPRSDVPAAASNRQVSCVCAQETKRHHARSLSQEKAQHARAHAAYARRTALGGMGCCPMNGQLRQQDGPLRRCTAALRRASRGLQQAGFLRMCARNQAPPRALSLPGGGAERSLAKCARRAALVGVGSFPMEAHSASETALSLGARSRSHVPAAASNKLLSCACAQEKAQPRALSLSREGAARAQAAYARRAALVGMGFCPKEAHCASETALSLGAPSRSVVPAAGSNKQLSCACTQEKVRQRALSLSGGGAEHSLRSACAALR